MAEDATTRARLKLLLLDDHQAARDALVRRLASEPRVVVAGDTGDVEQAVALAASAAPDAILVDPRRRDGDGIDAILSLACADLPGKPLIAVHTSYYDADQWMRARAAGAHDWILKQFDVNALVDRLIAAVDRRAHLCA